MTVLGYKYWLNVILIMSICCVENQWIALGCGCVDKISRALNENCVNFSLKSLNLLVLSLAEVFAKFYILVVKHFVEITKVANVRVCL